MAEQDTSQERTEEATPKRRQDARDKGDIARSKELNTTAVLMAGAGGLLMFGSELVHGLSGMLRYNFELSRQDVFDTEQMMTHLLASSQEALVALFPLLLLILVAAMVSPIALGGWVMSGKTMAPKWDRISPLAGIKRMFSARSAVELVKSLGKFLLVTALSIALLHWMTGDILALAKQDVLPAMAHAMWVVGWAGLALSASTLIIAFIDVPFQIFDHAKKLKMTHQEIKDELKNTEGKPEVKNRIRQLQYEISQRRMMAAVPEADVVITNPEHYSVALRYNSDDMGAPILVAKGVDEVAMKIREIAKAHEVPILASPPLARAVFHSTKIDTEIPAGLYVAVAQVLAYVFQLRRYRKGHGTNPGKLSSLPIPDELRRDD